MLKMASGLEIVNEAIRAHIDGEEITQSDWNQYLAVVCEGEGMIESTFDDQFQEFQTALSQYLEVGRSYYLYFGALPALATYKKLVPVESDRDMRSLCFAVWFGGMVDMIGFVIDDLVDNDEQRAGMPALHKQLGAPLATTLSFCALIKLTEIVDKLFDSKPYGKELRQIVRDHATALFQAIMADTSPRTREFAKQRLTWEWHKTRAHNGYCMAFWNRIRAAFVVAGVSIKESETGKISWKLVQLVADTGRAVDDAYDMEQDVQRRVATWPFLMAHKVDAKLLEDHLVNQNPDTPEKVVQLCFEMNIWREVQKYELEQRSLFQKMIAEAPDTIPSLAWKALYNFNVKYYVAYYQGGQEQPQLLD